MLEVSHNHSGKIAHIIVDDKFIDMALRQFDEILPQNNLPIIIGEKRKMDFVKRDDIRFLSRSQLRAFLRSSECTAVIFHSLPDHHLPLLSIIPRDKKVFWLGWGYDYYDRLLSDAYQDGLLLPETKKLMDIKSCGFKSKLTLMECKKIIKLALAKIEPSSAELLARVDYFSPVLDVEYVMAKELNPWFSPEFISWNYGTAEDDLGGDNIKFGICRNNILIGNSSAPENNHVEVFQLLSKNLNLSGRKIIVPLSYGNEFYRDKVVAIGRQMFGTQFVPLIEFMSKDAYIELIDSCGYVFMNHLRQQAMGNVFIMMMKGAKVFMNSQSPAFKWLIRKGALVYSVDSLQKESEAILNVLTPINKIEHMKNVDITLGHCGREVQINKTRQLIEIALGNKITIQDSHCDA